MSNEFCIHYIDIGGVERVSSAKRNLGAAIEYARVLERHGGTIISIIGPTGSVAWQDVSAMAETGAELKPPIT